MDLATFLRQYEQSSQGLAVRELLASGKPQRLQLRGLSGSLDAVVVAATYRQQPGLHVVVASDREEADYLYDDLHQLLRMDQLHFFPSSYKRPYTYETVENANVLMRAEVLSQLNSHKTDQALVVTYAEALAEKVINRKSLTANTWTAKVGEEIDLNFLVELLDSYGFDRADFAYEAGQYSVRGGILDIYSFAGDLPYRLELFGDEIESIRTFDPVTQLSKDPQQRVSIIPNVRTHLQREERQGFFQFLPTDSVVWLKDRQLVVDMADQALQKAQTYYKELQDASGNSGVVLPPEDLSLSSTEQAKQLLRHHMIEIGSSFSLRGAETITFQTSPQPSFKKNFERLAEALVENQHRGLRNFLVADSLKQIERLRSIFEELEPEVELGELHLSLREGFMDQDLGLACFTDHQIFERFHRSKVHDKRQRSKALTLKELHSLQPGDYVTHIDYGIGRFAGLEKVDAGGRKQEAIRLVYKDNDLLYASIHSLHKISKYSGQEGVAPQVNKLGSQEWDKKKKRVKGKVKEVARDLIRLYAQRTHAKGHAFQQDSYLQAELESSFIYEDTPDQAKATEDVKADMEAPHPMDRLVCGDVGFGKTEIAIRAAFKAVQEGKQVAVLVPTTILAVQHYHTFRDRLAEFGVDVAYINRFKTTKVIKETLAKTADGKLDILIGTHRIVGKDVHFKDLGLLVIDEEQKFGVKTKDKLKELRVNIDVLTLTATPIPRTLHFSLMGARDLSIISTPPPNRQPVTTELRPYGEEIIRDAIAFELNRHGQVFVVHNRVGSLPELANTVIKLVPDARVGVAHGQMDGPTLEKTMLRFVEGDYDVLVSTNIIESGLDIPNANTIIINQAHLFGLSDLHQMRGRVGRSNRKAYCYLLSPASSTITQEARKRLSTLEQFSGLGDGIQVAMKDLDIRGAGDLLGAEQTGFINDLGFEAYHKVLEEAVNELKENEFAELFQTDLAEVTKALVADTVVETDMEILIPEEYIANISERLKTYNDLDNVKTPEELEALMTSLKDRFGPWPEPVKDLADVVRLRWLAEQLGFEKMLLKGGKLKAYLMPSGNEAYYQSTVFGNILAYAQAHPRQTSLKETNKRLILTIEDARTLAEVQAVLTELQGEAVEE